MTHPLEALLPQVDLLIFDADGVLYDTEFLSNQAWVDALAERGLALSLTEMMDISVGNPEPVTRAIIAERFGLNLPEGFDQQIRNRFDALNRDSLTAIDGVPEFLDRLPTDKRRCICSNAQRARSLFKLQVSGLARYFPPELVFSGLDFSRPKPDPAMHRAALARFAVQPERALVIEDSVVGAQAAVAAGIPFVGYLGVAFRPEETRAQMTALGARLIFDSWR